MAEFPTYEQMAKNVAEKALDEFLYDGKSIREWMKIIAEQPIGHWENHFDEDNEINGYVCSECKKAFFYDETTDFCPHCGLRMIGSIEEGWW